MVWWQMVGKKENEMCFFGQDDAAYFFDIDISDIKEKISYREKIRNKIEKRARNAKEITDIMCIIAEEFGLTLNELKSEQRSRNIAWPRAIAWWLSRRHTQSSLPQIGNLYNKDHTTILTGCRRVEDWRLSSSTKNWYNKAKQIERRLI